MDNSVLNRDNYVIEGCIIHSFPHRPRKKLEYIFEYIP